MDQYMKNLLVLLCYFLLLMNCTIRQNAGDAVNSLADDYVEKYFMAFPEFALISGAPDILPSKLSDNSLLLELMNGIKQKIDCLLI